MKPAYMPRTTRPAAELPPLTWPAPLDALPPLQITKSPESPGWADTAPIGREVFEVEQGSAFEESLTLEALMHQVTLASPETIRSLEVRDVE